MKEEQRLKEKTIQQLLQYARQLGINLDNENPSREDLTEGILREVEQNPQYDSLNDFLLEVEGGSGIIEDASGYSGEDWEGEMSVIEQSSPVFLLSPFSPKPLPPELTKLKKGQPVVLKEQRYTIQESISSATGEAIVFKATDEMERMVAIKFYKDHGPNVEALIRIKGLEDDNILKLHDFGTGNEGYLGRFCFEVSDFARGGNLLKVSDFRKKYSCDYIQMELIPSLFNGIRSLHREGIIHCDLKPQNIFFRDEQQNRIVIGDYGSAQTQAAGIKRDIVSRVIGSRYYLPPEQSHRVVSPQNDYYSMGMVLIHLLYPEQFARDEDFRIVDDEKFKKLLLRQISKEDAIIDFKEDYEEVNLLIEGLTKYYPAQRWGKEEVEKWLEGKPVESALFLPGIDRVDILKANYFNKHFVTELYVKPEEGMATTEHLNFPFRGVGESWDEMMRAITLAFVKKFSQQKDIFIRHFSRDVHQYFQKGLQAAIFARQENLFKLLDEQLSLELKYQGSEIPVGKPRKYRLSYVLWDSLTPYLHRQGVERAAVYKEASRAVFEADFREVKTPDQFLQQLRSSFEINAPYIAPGQEDLIGKDFLEKRKLYLKRKNKSWKKALWIALAAILVIMGILLIWHS